MKKETKEIVALTEKWLTEIKKITVDYTKAIDKLADLETLLKNQLKSRTQRFIDLAPLWSPILTVIFTLIMVQFLLNTMPCGVKIEFSNVDIYKECPHK